MQENTGLLLRDYLDVTHFQNPKREREAHVSVDLAPRSRLGFWKTSDFDKEIRRVATNRLWAITRPVAHAQGSCRLI